MSSSLLTRQFNQVRQFNRVFMAKRLAPDHSNFKELYDFRTSLIQEEFEELQHAIRTSDSIEVIDAFADILYVAYGMLDVFSHPEYQLTFDDVDKLRPDQLYSWDEIELGHAVYRLTDKMEDVTATQMKLLNLVEKLYTACPAKIDMDLAFDMVHTNNMTKACKTRQEAEMSAELLVKNGKCEECRVIQNDDYFVVVNAKTGKVCKPVNYKSVDLRCAFGDINLFE
jgi:predicted HAD superfamily Cof-like phosphohydrolase